MLVHSDSPQHSLPSPGVTHLPHELWVIEHVAYLWISLHELLHLGIGHDHLPHEVRVRHHVLHQGILHDLGKHLWVGHQLPLHLLLELHEVGRAHPKVAQPSDATEASWRRNNTREERRESVTVSNCKKRMGTLAELHPHKSRGILYSYGSQL